MAYRQGKKQRRAPRPEEGLVADMVRQFADPYAFVRELVQNGIDAGASALEVRARHCADGMADFSVTDDGEGMDRETIEGPLLTLFSSSKEGESGKIGKYGVGFVSVFAMGPTEVVVETWRGEESFVLRLSPDHSYQLEAGEGCPGTSPSGTRVALRKPMDGDTFRAHAHGVAQALARWCRHAHLPIHAQVEREGSDEAPRRTRIDRPLEVRAPVQLRAEVEDAIFAVGPALGGRYLGDDAASAHDRCFAGFYNHGLTLFESEQPAGDGLEEVRFKVDSPALQHTLSRDDVRRDEAYRRVLTQVRELYAGPVRRELVAELARVAEAVAAPSEDGSGARRYVALLAAACSASMHLEPAEVTVPLAAELDGRRVCRAADLVRGREQPVFAASRDELTAEVARAGRPVLLAVHPHVPELLAHRLKRSFVQVDHVFTLLQELGDEARPKAERALLRHTKRALEATGIALGRVRLGRAFPQGSVARAAVALSDGQRGGWHLGPVQGRPGWSQRFGRVAALLLLVQHPAVAKALELATREPAAAGQLLARYLLTEDRGELSKAVSDALLDRVAHGRDGVAARRS